MNEATFVGILIILYGMSGIISMIAYLPTIKDLLNGIPSANFTTYFLWFVYYFISVLYGIFVLYDWLFIVVSGLDALIILVIVLLIVRIQRGEIMLNIKDKQGKIFQQCGKILRKIKRRKKTDL